MYMLFIIVYIIVLNKCVMMYKTTLQKYKEFERQVKKMRNKPYNPQNIARKFSSILSFRNTYRCKFMFTIRFDLYAPVFIELESETDYLIIKVNRGNKVYQTPKTTNKALLEFLIKHDLLIQTNSPIV